MTDTTSTVGPWEARGRTIWEPGKTALSIASVNQRHPDAVAITALVAAAPALLAAAKLQMQAHEALEGRVGYEKWQRMEDAAIKALREAITLSQPTP